MEPEKHNPKELQQQQQTQQLAAIKVSAIVTVIVEAP
jgi:hypothetical protein